jgi:hypothetical protein
MSKPLANCKTYIEGKGWLYNWELNKALESPKTVQELVDDINHLTELKKRVASLSGAKKDIFGNWMLPTQDQSYIRDRELQNKYQ